MIATVLATLLLAAVLLPLIMRDLNRASARWHRRRLEEGIDRLAHQLAAAGAYTYRDARIALEATLTADTPLRRRHPRWHL